MRTSSSGEVALGIFAVFGSLVLVIGAAAAWLTHVVWIVKALASTAGATAGQIVLGVLGAFVPPVGVIHGLILWFS